MEATLSEIGDLKALSLKDKRFVGSRCDLTCMKLSKGRCVKFGPDVRLAEAEAMEYVRQNTTIPIPKVHHAFTLPNPHTGRGVEDDSPYGFIVMDFVEGDNLSDTARFMSAPKFAKIAKQLRDFAQQLRELGGSGCKAMGAWAGGPYDNIYYRDRETGPPIRDPRRRRTEDPFAKPVLPQNPFSSMAELRDYWEARWRRVHVGEPPAVDLSRISTDVVLSHGDLSLHNIIVKDGSVAGVIDWDTFGWYPAFWEKFGCLRSAHTKVTQAALVEEFGGRSDEAERPFLKLINDAFIFFED